MRVVDYTCLRVSSNTGHSRPLRKEFQVSDKAKYRILAFLGFVVGAAIVMGVSTVFGIPYVGFANAAKLLCYSVPCVNFAALGLAVLRYVLIDRHDVS